MPLFWLSLLILYLFTLINDMMFMITMINYFYHQLIDYNHLCLIFMFSHFAYFCFKHCATLLSEILYSDSIFSKDSFFTVLWFIFAKNLTLCQFLHLSSLQSALICHCSCSTFAYGRFSACRMLLAPK